MLRSAARAVLASRPRRDSVRIIHFPLLLYLAYLEFLCCAIAKTSDDGRVPRKSVCPISERAASQHHAHCMVKKPFSLVPRSCFQCTVVTATKTLSPFFFLKVGITTKQHQQLESLPQMTLLPIHLYYAREFRCGELI